MHIIRTATVHDPDASALPPEFRKVLTRQDIAAIRTGPAYFSKIAAKDAPKWLADLLGHCANSRYTLQFHSSGEVPYRPYFRFNWQGEPAISLPRRAKLRRDMPPFLRRLYKLIGAFRENEFNYAGGLHPGDTLVPVSKTGIWVEPGGSIDPSTAIPFLETFSGSELCYLPHDSGAWLKACRFEPVDNLECEVARYFEALLKGTRI